MCNNGHDHSHDHPEIVQLMAPSRDLYAVYKSGTDLNVPFDESRYGIKIVPVVFLALIKHGQHTSVEGFFASAAIGSCEDVEGFTGYAGSLEEAEKLYT